MTTHVNHDTDEARVVTGHRWWTLDEIAASPELFLPRELRSDLAALVGGELPSNATDVDW